MNFERIVVAVDTKMPLSEFYESINGKNESQQPKSTDISYIPNDEFVELIWEKGQIMMQGQSNKAKKTPVSNNFQFHTPKLQDKDGILDLPIPELGLNQDDDDMVPWFNYPLDDYCSDLLPEISGVTVNEPHMHKDPYSHSHTHKNFILESVRFDQSNTPKLSRNSHLFSWSLDQVHNPDPIVRSGVSDIGVSSNNCRSKPHNAIHRESAPIQGSLGNLEKKVQKQNSVLPNSASTLMNFSHFSKPAAVARANHGTVANHGPQKEIGQPSLDPVTVGSKQFVSKPLDEPRCTEKPTTGNDKSSSVVVDAKTSKGCPETVKSNEQVGATSSVCSENSAKRASNDLTKDSKRKTRDTEDFECQSQDVDEELLGTKTAGGSRGGTGSKRSRAAEVHNMSERRRRDRINEKMRALQELIPNCSKVDKASMLGEAIEYLKTLQLQVQIMSMGTGLCMPPMMFPPGMQHMHPHFSPMGIGMGMDYGMGMDMNGGHPHMFPFPPNATLGSRHPPPIYGHPSQGMQMLFPQQPMPSIPINPAVRQTDVPPSSKDHHAITQTSNQPQVANKSLVQAMLADKNDQGLKAGSNAAGVD